MAGRSLLDAVPGVPCSFLLLRVSFALLSRTWHVPDETWQSVEIAHGLVFGYGYKTWEWRNDIALRTYLYPLLFYPSFTILKILGMDSPWILVLIPKLIQALVSAIGDVAIFNFARRRFSRDPNFLKWFVFVYSSHWFINYCSSRTLINSLEMTLTSIGLSLYPFESHIPKPRGLRRLPSTARYVMIISLSFVLRPTTAIFWLPLLLCLSLIHI